MKQKINPYNRGSKAVNALHLLGQKANQSTLGIELMELIHFRVSQINGCAFCLDMHSKNLRARGESEQRLYLLSAWRESPFYSEKERAALAFAEALTVLNGRELPAGIFDEAQRFFTADEMVDLTMCVIAINSYNRINIAFGADVGSYRVGEFAEVAAN